MSPTSRVLMIADDLTGALDSAVAFRARGLAARVATRPDALEAALAGHAPVVAVSTNSREVPAPEARQILQGLSRILETWSGIVFKKIDSRMKGNVAVEVEVVRAALGSPVLACPAVPRLGRFVRDGALWGAGVDLPIPVASSIGAEARILEAETVAEIAAGLPDDLASALYVGAAGLAEALAVRLRDNAAPQAASGAIPVPCLLAVGSRDPVTDAQVAALHFDLVPAPNGDVPVLRGADLGGVRMTAASPEIAGSLAADRFAGGIAREMRRLGARTLFACGGETARAVLDALDIHLLDIEAELFPGMPLSRCPRTGLCVITKSGGFGTPDLLVKLANKFAKSVRTG